MAAEERATCHVWWQRWQPGGNSRTIQECGDVSLWLGWSVASVYERQYTGTSPSGQDCNRHNYIQKCAYNYI